jgi:ferritin-like metal-binding protein YciE
MVSAATSNDLKKAFENHLRGTEGQIERLIQVCNILGANPKGKTCEGMKSFLEEGLVDAERGGGGRCTGRKFDLYRPAC